MEEQVRGICYGYRDLTTGVLHKEKSLSKTIEEL